jgi:hypothetical protein
MLSRGYADSAIGIEAGQHALHWQLMPGVGLRWVSSIIISACRCAESYSAILAIPKQEIVYYINSMRIAEVL